MSGQSDILPEISCQLAAGDRPELERILQSTGFFYDFEIEVALSLADETVAAGEEKSGYYWIRLMIDDRLAGFACLGPNPSSVHSWDLYWIAVSNEYRNRHFGSLLLVRAEERAAALGARILWIETSGRPLYEPTRHFYTRNGYELEATLREFYGPGDPKLIYRKLL